MAGKHRRGWADLPEPLPTPVIDSHAHLDQIEDYRKDFSDHQVDHGRAALAPKTYEELIHESRAVGIEGIVHCSCDLSSIERIPQILSSSKSLRGAVGIHPNEAAMHAHVDEIAPDGLPKKFEPWHELSLADATSRMYETLVSHPQITAIGETGLDFFRTAESGHAIQIQSFRNHIQLAKELNYPLQIHDRLAHSEILEILDRDTPPQSVIFHSFSSNRTFAQACLERGFYLAFGGTITFKKNQELREALRVTPLTQLLLETDSPYLAPEPYRGTPNVPYLTNNIARFAAEILELPLVEVCQAVYKNAQNLFKFTK